MFKNFTLPKYVSSDQRIIVVKNKNPIINIWSRKEKKTLYNIYLKNRLTRGGFIRTIKEFSANNNRTYAATKKNLYILIKSNIM